MPVNKTEPRTVMNIDVAPTFVDLGTGQVPDDMDGRSFAGFFANGTRLVSTHACHGTALRPA